LGKKIPVDIPEYTVENGPERAHSGNMAKAGRNYGFIFIA
jgi:hypothetical protein